MSGLFLQLGNYQRTRNRVMQIFETTADLTVCGESREMPIIVEYIWHKRIPPRRDFGVVVAEEEPGHADIENIKIEISNGVYIDGAILTENMKTAIADEIAYTENGGI